MATYKTPDVYVEEIPVFPPSVAEVATAIPAFVGHTQQAVFNGQDLSGKAVRITSLMEYHQRFGMSAPYCLEKIQLSDSHTVDKIMRKCCYHLYDSLRLFFQNGGSTCYIVSVGNFDAKTPTGKIEMAKLIDGLDVLSKVDEVTLLLFPDAVNLSGKGLYALQQAALKQCNELQDRFVIMDLYESSIDDDSQFDWMSGVQEFRDRIGINYLKYGAAYTPHIVASIDRKVGYDHIANRLFDNDGKEVSLKSLPHDPKVAEILNNLNQASGDAAKLSNYRDESTIANFLSARFKGQSVKTIEEGFEILKSDFTDKLKKIEGADQPPKETAAPDAPDKKKKAAPPAKPGSDQEVRDSQEQLIKYLFEILLMVVAPWGEKDRKRSILSPIMYQHVRDKMTEFLSSIDKETVEKYFNNWNEDKVKKMLATIREENHLSPSDFENDVIGIFEGVDGKNVEVDVLTDQATVLGEFVNKLTQCISNIQKAARINKDNLETSLLENFPVYKDIVNKLKHSLSTIPPSGAVAGVYSAVDNDRGVWKAPANVSLNSVLGLTQSIDNKEQENLNVDVTSGKSINAIRPFTGKGLLVWGARTLAGNDNEWR